MIFSLYSHQKSQYVQHFPFYSHKIISIYPGKKSQGISPKGFLIFILSVSHKSHDSSHIFFRIFPYISHIFPGKSNFFHPKSATTFATRPRGSQKKSGKGRMGRRKAPRALGGHALPRAAAARLGDLSKNAGKRWECHGNIFHNFGKIYG